MKNKIFDFGNNNYQETTTIGDEVYSTIDLINRAKDLEIIEIPLCSIDLAMAPWNDINNIYQFLGHYERCYESDINYPILLSPHGGVMDGWHRICKAIVLGKKTIKAKHLKDMPLPITYNKEEKDI